jgi:hypothetical protein
MRLAVIEKRSGRRKVPPSSLNLGMTCSEVVERLFNLGLFEAGLAAPPTSSRL